MQNIPKIVAKVVPPRGSRRCYSYCAGGVIVTPHPSLAAESAFADNSALHASTLPCLAASWRGVRSLVKRNIRTAFQTGARRETFGGKTCHSSHRPTSALCCKSRRHTSTCPFRMELRRGVVILIELHISCAFLKRMQKLGRKGDVYRP